MIVGIRAIPHDLVERVESGTGADRELDALVLCSVLAPAGSKVEQSRFNGAWCVYEPVSWGKTTWRLWDGAGRLKQGEFTSSLDAVVSLIEQKLPAITDNSAADFLAASIDEMMVRGWRPSEPNIPQICRSVLAAFLRALQEARTLADAHSKNPPEAEHG